MPDDYNTNNLPTLDQIADLKKLTSNIIRSQGNRFIKELLRKKNIKIGTNKADFEKNLIQAIETGNLVLADVEEWSKRVEGWGNQHVYLYNLSAELLDSLTEAKIRDRLKQAKLEELWNKETILEFPEEPKLTSINFKDPILSIIWQESSPDWTPIPEKNYQEQEGLDEYEYRAYRKIEHRAFTRFEAHIDKKLAGLFIANPIRGEEHQTAVNEAKSIINRLMDLNELEKQQVDISTVSRNLDQKMLPDNINVNPEVKTQKSRLASGGAYVEFAANSSDKAYWEEPAIDDVRKSVRDNQIKAFQGSDGVFIFQPGIGENQFERPLRIQLYGNTDRIRLRAQMDAREVWLMLSLISKYQ